MSKTIEEVCEAIDALPDALPVYAKRYYNQIQWDMFDVGRSEDLKALVFQYRRLKSLEDSEKREVYTGIPEF